MSTSGTALEVELKGQKQVDLVLVRLNNLGKSDMSELLEVAGAITESQTRRRISEEKESPEGQPWKAWSRNYARSRHGGHSLLQNKGDLLDSITTAIGTGADKAYVGSNLPYAPIHQFGGTSDMPPGPAAIPARPYLGWSPQNLDELSDELNAWADDLLSRRAA